MIGPTECNVLRFFLASAAPNGVRRTARFVRLHSHSGFRDLGRPAAAYPCKPPDPHPVASDTLAGLVEIQRKDCEPEPASSPAKRGNADPMSFMFFIGIVSAVVFLPAALGPRQDLSPQ